MGPCRGPSRVPMVLVWGLSGLMLKMPWKPVLPNPCNCKGLEEPSMGQAPHIMRLQRQRNPPKALQGA